MLTLNPETLAGMIDQTLLKPYVTHDDFIRFCAESAEYGFKTIAISSAMVTRCRKWLGNSPVGITAVAGFPLGQMTIAAKVYESIAAIEDGANEIDYVVNMVALKSGELSLVEEEMCAITEACHARGAGCKVIFENCYLTDEEKPAKGTFECVVAVRPEQVVISREPVEGAIEVSVYASQPAGSETIVTLKAGRDEFLVKEIGQAHYAIDQKVWAIIDPDKINVYNKETTRLIKRVV